jgi:protein required for attachment to host cells
MQNKEHPQTWVIVADKCIAKIFRIVKFPKIQEISILEHPESRLLNQELVSERPGRNFQSMGLGRSAYQPETEPTQVEAIKFASIVGKSLTTAHQKGEFSRLYIFAEPSFLGLLRQHIDSETKKSIVSEIAKVLTTSDSATIEHHLSEI